MTVPHRLWLARRLRHLGLTRADLALKIGVSQRQVERWFAGKGAHLSTQYDIALALELPPEQVYALFKSAMTSALGDEQRSALRAPVDPMELGEALQGRRLVQIALDISDLDQAVRLAQVAAMGGADLVEVGDPLIKRHGMNCISRVREAVPEMPLVAEFASSDWVDEQIGDAAEAGADLVYLLGLDRRSRIERAVRTARAQRVGLCLCIPGHASPEEWCSMAESAGLDVISIIRNIDSAGSSGDTSLRLREVAAIAHVPLAISGGFTPDNLVEVLDDDWRIVIVGSAFVHARNPAEVLASLRKVIE